MKKTKLSGLSDPSFSLGVNKVFIYLRLWVFSLE